VGPKEQYVIVLVQSDAPEQYGVAQSQRLADPRGTKGTIQTVARGNGHNRHPFCCKTLLDQCDVAEIYSIMSRSRRQRQTKHMLDGKTPHGRSTVGIASTKICDREVHVSNRAQHHHAWLPSRRTRTRQAKLLNTPADRTPTALNTSLLLVLVYDCMDREAESAQLL
jgi:hypothetical protein